MRGVLAATSPGRSWRPPTTAWPPPWAPRPGRRVGLVDRVEGELGQLAGCWSGTAGPGRRPGMISSVEMSSPTVSSTGTSKASGSGSNSGQRGDVRALDQLLVLRLRARAAAPSIVGVDVGLGPVRSPVGAGTACRASRGSVISPVRAAAAAVSGRAQPDLVLLRSRSGRGSCGGRSAGCSCRWPAPGPSPMQPMQPDWWMRAPPAMTRSSSQPSAVSVLEDLAATSG